MRLDENLIRSIRVYNRLLVVQRVGVVDGTRPSLGLAVSVKSWRRCAENRNKYDPLLPIPPRRFIINTNGPAFLRRQDNRHCSALRPSVFVYSSRTIAKFVQRSNIIASWRENEVGRGELWYFPERRPRLPVVGRRIRWLRSRREHTFSSRPLTFSTVWPGFTFILSSEWWQ